MTGWDHTVAMTSNIIVRHYFSSRSEYKFSDNPLLLCYPFAVGSRVWGFKTPRPSGPPTRWVALPLGAVNPAARQTLYGSFDLPGCGFSLHSLRQDPWLLSICRPLCYLSPPHPTPPVLCWKIKNLAWKHDPCYRAHSVRADINHCFMEVSVRVYETCVLLVFLFLTQITEQYLDVVTAEEWEVKKKGERKRGHVFPLFQTVMQSLSNREDTALDCWNRQVL